MQSELIAYCGLYCGACSFRIAGIENNKKHIQNMPSYYDHVKEFPLEICPGCRLENKCGECKIRDCAISKKIENCSQCEEFYCEKIKKFNNDGKQHHSEVINNLKLLKEFGEIEWLKLIKKK